MTVKPSTIFTETTISPGWRRDEFTKKYDNDQLADPLLSATAVPAHTFGARGVPGVMYVIEILGMQ